MNVWSAASLKLQLPDVTGGFTVLTLEALAPQHHMPLHASSIGCDHFPVARVGERDHGRNAAGFDEWAVVEFSKGAAHRGSRFPGPLGDDSTGPRLVAFRRTPSCHRHDGPMIVPGSEIVLDSKLGIVNVTLMMANGPFGGLLGTNRIGPTESHNTRAYSDAKPSGFRLHPATGRARRPRWCRFEQRCGCGDHLGRREPQPQCVDRAQLARRDPVVHRLADIFGTYNKPAGRGRVEAGCRGRCPADRWRSPALRPGGLGRSRPPVHRGTCGTEPERRFIWCR